MRCLTDGRRLAAVQLAGRHDRPGDARQLVGERHGDKSRRPTLEKLARPNRQRIGSFVEPAKTRSRPEHEQSPQIGGLSGILCERPVASLRLNEPFVEHYGELGLCLAPLARRHFPFSCGRAQDEIQELRRGVIGWKMTSRAHGAA